MAYIKNIAIKATVKKAINYICDIEKEDNVDSNGVKKGITYISSGKKTRNGELISCNFGDWRNADALFENTRERYQKNDKILAHHFVQSFDPVHRISPEEAHRIANELAEKQFGKLGFDYIVATHVDKGHIHNHILVNNVARKGLNAGKKYYHDKRSYRYVRKMNIDLCRKRGIPAVDCKRCDEEYKKLHTKRNEDEEKEIQVELESSYQSTSYIDTPAYDSWSEEQASNMSKIKTDINEQVLKSVSWDDFILHMEKIGYRIDWKNKDGSERKYVTYFAEGAKVGRRDRKLGSFFTKEAIIGRIEKSMMKGKEERKDERKGEKKDAGKKPEVTFEKLPWNFKKSVYLVVNPKYVIKKYGIKKFYVKRSPLSQSLAQIYYVELYKQFGTKESSSHKNRLIIKETNQKLKYIDTTKSIMREFNIYTLSDFATATLKVHEKKEELYKEIQRMKYNLLYVEQKLSLFENLEKYREYNRAYEEIYDEAKKEDYFRKYKNHIQNYRYAFREIDINHMRDSKPEIEEERRKLLFELTQRSTEIKDLESKLNQLRNAEKFLSGEELQCKGKMSLEKHL